MEGFSLKLGGLGAQKKAIHRALGANEKTEGPERELIAGVAEGGIQSLKPQESQGPKTISRQENTFVTGVGRKGYIPSFVPLSTSGQQKGGDKFEKVEDEKKADQTYGLHVSGRGPEEEREGASGPSSGAGDGRKSDKKTALDAILDRDAAQLQHDLTDLPDVPDSDAYQMMPIEDFGAAMLRGMGWTDGKAVGKNPDKVIRAVEYVRRADRLGLGAQAAAPAKEKKHVKQGDQRDSAKDLVYIDKEGRHRHVKPVDEVLIERPKPGVHVGKTMQLLEGRHSGFICEVLRLEAKEEGRSDRCQVRLKASGEIVTVRCKELGEKDETVSDKPGRTGDQGDSKRDRPGSSSHFVGKREVKRSKTGDDSAGDDRVGDAPWVVDRIRVRIVNKSIAGGQLYLKKAVVTDVPRPGYADLRIEDTGRILQGVSQSVLETVIPKGEGQGVIVVRGPHRGRPAVMLQKNVTTGLAAIRLEGEEGFERVQLDDISEYAAV